jgi:predicted nuclease with RNAse H fold
VSERPLVVGVDVAAARPCIAVALQPSTAGGRLETVGWLETTSSPAHEDRPGRTGAPAADERATSDRGLAGASPSRTTRRATSAAALEVAQWVEKLSPAASVVAVDAPQAFNRRLLARSGEQASRSRVCDWELLHRRIGIYQVPSRAEVEADPAKLPLWMRVGLDIFAQLKRRGYEVPADGELPGAFGRPAAVIEVYPYAAFAALVGQRLTRKTTREGLRLRIAALRGEGVVWDRGHGEEYYDHDSLDALAAALTAWRYYQGAAGAVGNPREGLIWLPVARERFEQAFPAAGSHRTARPA